MPIDEWMKLPQRFTNFEMNVFPIMPNHIQAILSFNETLVGAGLAPAQEHDDNRAGVNPAPTRAPAHDQNDSDQNRSDQKNRKDDNRAGASPAPTNAAIGAIIGAYKSMVSNACLEIFKSKNEKMGKLWQRNYYEHIISMKYP